MTANPYGSCPHCWAPGGKRERRPNGNDTCINGHVYPSAKALPCPLISPETSGIPKSVPKPNCSETTVATGLRDTETNQDSSDA